MSTPSPSLSRPPAKGDLIGFAHAPGCLRLQYLVAATYDTASGLQVEGYPPNQWSWVNDRPTPHLYSLPRSLGPAEAWEILRSFTET